jgi:hypothetical protein
MLDPVEPRFHVPGGCCCSLTEVAQGGLAFFVEETVDRVLDEYEVPWIEIVAIARVAKNFERDIAK